MEHQKLLLTGEASVLAEEYGAPVFINIADVEAYRKALLEEIELLQSCLEESKHR